MSYRDTIIEGRLGANAELKYLPNGTALCNVSIAVSEKRGDAWETHWFRVNIWARTAEVLAPKLLKGTTVLVMCKPSVRSFKDKNGMTREITEFDAYRVYLIAPKEVEQQDVGQMSTGVNDSDIPF